MTSGRGNDTIDADIIQFMCLNDTISDTMDAGIIQFICLNDTISDTMDANIIQSICHNDMEQNKEIMVLTSLTFFFTSEYYMKQF